MKSKITGQTYLMEDVFIILNPKQCCAYMENDYYPIDVFVGKDNKLCFAFPKSNYGKELFDKWVKHELN